MNDTWRVWWAANEAGYRVLVCQRARIVRRVLAETLNGEDSRQAALDRAIELALEYRVPLANIFNEKY